MGRKTLDDVPALVRRREEFTIGNMSARCWPGGSTYRIEGGWNTILSPQLGTTYAVYSYATPIGWIDEMGVAVIPPQRHSVSTGRHQGLIRWSLTDDPGHPKAQAARRARYEEMFAAYYKAKAEEQREQRNAAARYKRALERELREERAREARELQEALRSIVQGPSDEVVLLGIEGEKAALKSAAKALVRH